MSPARLEKMTTRLLHQKPGKGFGVMWRLKEARHSELSVSEGRSWKGKQPLLNEPLKGCPLYLGFLIFIVNPSQASFVAESAIILSPKSGGWKKPQRTYVMTIKFNPTMIFFLKCLCEGSFVKCTVFSNTLCNPESVEAQTSQRWRDYRRETTRSGDGILTTA